MPQKSNINYHVECISANNDRLVTIASNPGLPVGSDSTQGPHAIDDFGVVKLPYG